MEFFKIICSPHRWLDVFFLFAIKRARKGRNFLQRIKFGFHKSVSLGDVNISGRNIEIGENTYFNSGYISSGDKVKVKIGKWCAIGYNVSIVACTHSVALPTGPEKLRPIHSGDVQIGNGVWIGNNVVITPGVCIGDFCVIGANSVVLSDLPEKVVCAGVPCKVVKVKEEKDIKEHKKITGLI